MASALMPMRDDTIPSPARSRRVISSPLRPQAAYVCRYCSTIVLLPLFIAAYRKCS
jgi:hypothetical protein